MNEMNEDESMLLTPEEAERRRIQSLTERANTQTMGMRMELPEPELKSHGDAVRVTYESNGRFSIPPVLYFKNYRVSDVADLAVSREEDIVETMIQILKNLCTDKTVKIEEMTMEEFQETLVALKIQYNSHIHKHRWQHKCQEHEESPQVSTTEIDLTTLQDKSIEEAEEELREYHAKRFAEMSEEEFQDYLNSKYDAVVTSTREQEVAKIFIKEPVHVVVDGHDYEFRFARVGHVARGLRYAFDKYNKQVRRLKGKPTIAGMSQEETKEFRQEEMDKYEKEKQKNAVLASRALSIHSKDGQSMTIEQKIHEFSNMPVNVLESMTKFFDSINFGIVDEREIVCDLCGESERRSLHREFSPIDLLPSESNSDDGSTRKQGVAARTFIYM